MAITESSASARLAPSLFNLPNYFWLGRLSIPYPLSRFRIHTLALTRGSCDLTDIVYSWSRVCRAVFRQRVHNCTAMRAVFKEEDLFLASIIIFIIPFYYGNLLIGICFLRLYSIYSTFKHYKYHERCRPCRGSAYPTITIYRRIVQSLCLLVLRGNTDLDIILILAEGMFILARSLHRTFADIFDPKKYILYILNWHRQKSGSSHVRPCPLQRNLFS